MSFITISGTDDSGSEIDGNVTFGGIDMGNGSKPITVKALTDDTMVVKVPGGKHWTANHQPQASHPGEYQVWKISNCEVVRTQPRCYIKLQGKRIATFPLR
tara:strand:+ start:705 stop:1007 length:303 start_codon:yes stop_codon:yes gene_type:complete